ncbi:MAG: hypothetical protein AVDCRST_MAG15-1416, partial [uncultured Rubellimicrobium sp.]
EPYQHHAVQGHLGCQGQRRYPGRDTARKGVARRGAGGGHLCPARGRGHGAVRAVAHADHLPVQGSGELLFLCGAGWDDQGRRLVLRGAQGRCGRHCGPPRLLPEQGDGGAGL